MSEKVIKLFEDMEYSDAEVNHYIDLGSCNDEFLKEISGSVKTNYAVDGLRKTNQMIKDELHDGENVEQIIKVRNIANINAITMTSLLSGTFGPYMDFGVFNVMYFTQERILFPILNAANQPLKMKYKDLKDILFIEFSNKVIKVKKRKDGTLKIIKRMNLFHMFSIALVIALLIGVYFQDFFGFSERKVTGMILFAVIFGLYAAAKTFQYFSMDRIQMVFKDGCKLQVLIANDNYKECREYINKVAKRINEKTI